MGKVAVTSILFEYPNHFIPTFEKKLLREFNNDDYFLIRYESENENIKKESYYFKFTHYRIKKFVDYVKENILGKYDYFLLLDATDVGYIGNINNISKVMEEYNCNILFGAELNLWPVTQYSDLHKEKKIPNQYKFLNAGVFCAKPQEFINHVENILSRGLFGLCDQGNWQIEYLLHDDIQLDYNHKLVLNTYLAKNDFSVDGDIVNFKKNIPIFVHDNGGYNDDTVKLLEFFK